MSGGLPCSASCPPVYFPSPAGRLIVALLAVGFVARVLRSFTPSRMAKENQRRSLAQRCSFPSTSGRGVRGEGEHQWASRPVLCGYMGRASLFGVTSERSHGEAGSLYGTVGLSEAGSLGEVYPPMAGLLAQCRGIPTSRDARFPSPSRRPSVALLACPAVMNPLSRRERGRGEGERQWASRPVLCGYMGRASLFGVTSERSQKFTRPRRASAKPHTPA